MTSIIMSLSVLIVYLLTKLLLRFLRKNVEIALEELSDTLATPVVPTLYSNTALNSLGFNIVS